MAQEQANVAYRRISFGFGFLVFAGVVLAGAIEANSNHQHPVTVQTVGANQDPFSGLVLPVTLIGRPFLVRSQRGDSTAIGATSDYRVRVTLPRGTKTFAKIGQKVSVVLPILHHQKTQGVVEKIEAFQVEILLPRQVQELNGQEVRIEVPLEPDGIFWVPFASIYSPRGTKKQVFVVRNGRAEAVVVETIKLGLNSGIYVAAKLNFNDKVVVKGLDNLIAGDSVAVLAEETL